VEDEVAWCFEYREIGMMYPSSVSAPPFLLLAPLLPLPLPHTTPSSAYNFPYIHDKYDVFPEEYGDEDQDLEHR